MLDELTRERCLVVQAPPGAGKTTRVPRAMMESGLGPVVVLEPRRLAARLSAERVAEELCEKVGERVGYRVRFEEAVSSRTELTFVTEGIFLRMLAAAPTLPNIRTIVIDEFHERHLSGDVSLALCRALLSRRDDLRLVVMSATLDGLQVARRLACPLVLSEGRAFPVAIEFAPAPVEPDGVPRAIASATRQLVNEGLTGHVLVFLPGMGEIRRAQTACERIISEAQLEPLILHAEISKAEQQRAFARSEKRKLIFATNVAETSITIDGVEAVIDTGLQKVASHSVWSGMSTLALGKSSRASLDQRAGRAGRTRPGRTLRLFTKHDYDQRPADTVPEILRFELSESLLMLGAVGYTAPLALPWFDPPDALAVAQAIDLLVLLGAATKTRESEFVVTELGQQMAELGLPVRAARVVVEAIGKGFVAEAALLGALLAEGEIVRRTTRADRSGPSDLLADMDRMHEAAAVRFSADGLRAANLDAGAVRSVDRLADRLRRRFFGRTQKPASDLDLQRCLLVAFPDRVAKRRKPGGSELLMCQGGQAVLSPSSVALEPEWLLAIEADVRKNMNTHDRTGIERTGAVVVTRASAIEPDWLLDQFPDQLREQREYVFANERVERIEKLTYFNLPIMESRGVPALADDAELDAVARLLADELKRRGLAQAFDIERVTQLFERLRFLSEVDDTLPTIAAANAAEWIADDLPALCHGKSAFAELTTEELLHHQLEKIPSGMRAHLDRLAPTELKLPSGRKLALKYALGQPPFAESRLQDFFGMTESPKIAGGKVSVVLHLLAPNYRAVQVTSDLRGFWQRTYPDVRKELGRRYPRHHWPDDPLNPGPPPKRPASRR